METISLIDRIPFGFIQCSSKFIKDVEAGKGSVQEGAIYFVLDTKQILLGKNNELLPMGKSSSVVFGIKDTDLNNLDSNVSFGLQDLEEIYRSSYPQPNDLIFNKDGCFYRVLDVDNTQIKTIRLTVAGSGGGGGGGGGGSSSIVLAAYETNTDETIVYGDPCVLKYEFYATMDGASTGSGVREIIINGITKERKNIPQSTEANPVQSVDISKYLEPGDNYIQLKCSDVYGGYKILQFSRAVVKLEIDDSDLTAKGTKKILSTDKTTFSYGFVPYGVGDKTITYVLKKIDGTLVTSPVETFSDYGTKKIKIFDNLTYGIYTLDVSMTTEVNGVRLTPVTASYIIMCVANEPNPNTQIHQPLLASYMPIAAGKTEVQTVPQGKQIEIAYMLNDPAKKTDAPVTLSIRYKDSSNIIKDYPISDIRYINALAYGVWDTRNYPIGEEVYFAIKYTYTDAMTGDEKTLSSKEWVIKVVESDVSTDVVETDLLLALSANGRSNSEDASTRSTWSYSNSVVGDITTTFRNVNWVNNNNSGTGWLKADNVPVLRLNGKSSALINFYPFSFRNPDDPPEKIGYNLIESGFTFELDFAIRDVNNQEAVALKCMDDEGVGFEVSSNKVRFVGRNNIEVFANFNENERIRVTFVVESNKKTDQNEYVTSRLATIYLNGVMTATKQYSPGETFSQTTPVGIEIGSSDCSIDVYNIRTYGRALTSKEIVNNFIYDISDPVQQTAAYERNDIYDISNNISYSQLLDNNSIMTIIGPLPTYKGDKRGSTKDEDINDPTKEKVIVKYECLFDKTLSFEDYCQIDVQGTSSQYYIRKNWKIKCKNKQLIDQDQIKTKTFCMKADYADATGTHNTQHANFIHGLYNTKTPAQEDDPKCRTTIYGYPVLMFHQPTLEDNPIFIGKYNFNFDKGSEEVFGFTDDYEVECWEFCNNDSNACNFLGPVPLNWKDDFEPRYLAPFKINEGEENELEISFDRIEELQDKAVLSQAEQEELKIQRLESIKRFKSMHDWVTSTATVQVVDGKVLPITPKPLNETIVYDGIPYTEDNEAYRLAKFKNEFEDIFDLDFCLIYYVYTFVNLMVDQRAKNMFLTYWAETDRWQPWLYDNDTCFGLNNSGEIKYHYYHEDIDAFEGINVYNGGNSALWNNFRVTYPDKIQKTYEDLRKSKLTYNQYIERFITKGSDQWGEGVYNADIEYKYLQPLRDGNYNEKGEWVSKDSSHLPKVQGTGEEYLRFFVDKRLDYCDSKWFAGNFPDDFIEVRVSTPDDWAVIEPNHEITVTPYNNMYTCVRYKANGTNQTYRTAAGEPHTFAPLTSDYEEDLEAGVVGGKFNDTEVGIYGASNLSSIGDLSACYAREIKVGKATKLTELIAGSELEGYHNVVLDTIELSANKLLKRLNLSNCPTLSGDLNLADCPNVEELYLFGTSYNTVSLPASGHITTLHLPETLTKFVLRNQSSVSDFEIKSSDATQLRYRNLREVLIDNCPTMPTQEMAIELAETINQINASLEEGKKKTVYMAFTNVNWSFDSPEFLLSLIENPYIGSLHPETEATTKNLIYVTGTCHIGSLDGEEMERIKAGFSKDLKITYDELTADVEFCLGGEPLEEGENTYYYYKYQTNNTLTAEEFSSIKYIVVGEQEKPVSEVTLSEYFTFIPNQTNMTSATCKQNIETVRDLSVPITIFTKTVQGGDNCQNPVGIDIIAPKRYSSNKYDYEFSGWSYTPGALPSNTVLNNIEQNTKVYAAFEKEIRSYPVYFYNDPQNTGLTNPLLSYVGDSAIKYGEGVPDLPPNQTYPGALSADYTFTGWLPDPSKIVGPTNCYAQYSYTAYAPIRLVERKIIEYKSETLSSIGDYAFANCTSLTRVETPLVTKIGVGAFKGCSNLDTLIILINDICTLGAQALEGTKIKSGQGYIYVNDSQVDNYKNNDDWKVYKNQIKSINDLEVNN